MRQIIQRINTKRKLYDILSKIGSLFARTTQHEIDKTIQTSLIMIGELLKTDRIYIYTYDLINNTCSNTYEYCATGIDPVIASSQELSLEDAKDWVEMHQKGLPTYLQNINKQTTYLGLRSLFLAQGVKSLLCFPMKKKDELYGFIGFDYVKSFHRYDELEKHILSEYASMLMSLIERFEIEKKYTKNLQELEVVFQAMNQSPNGIVITDQHSMITYVNPRFEEITGYQASEVIGKNPKIQKSGVHHRSFYKKMYETINKGLIWEGELQNKKKSGELYWELDSMSAVFDSQGNVTHYIAIKTDITDKKKMELKLEEERLELEIDIKNRTIEIEDSQQATIIALAKLTESRDKDTGGHIERVQHLCRILVKSLRQNPKYFQLDSVYETHIYYASALHDIGKISIPDHILLKEDKLTKEEYELMKTHVTIGGAILSGMIAHYPNSELIKLGNEIALYHHEKWDGTGYNQGLKGEDIPISARIMALVDVYDALRSKRPYKMKMTHQEAYNIIIDQSGKHFDPEVIDAFKRVQLEFDKIYKRLAIKE
jgi:PAS domain S-box-containing protein